MNQNISVINIFLERHLTYPTEGDSTLNTIETIKLDIQDFKVLDVLKEISNLIIEDGNVYIKTSMEEKNGKI